MLKAYFDDAGTHGGSPVSVIGGLIGTVDQWSKLEKAWGEQLANPLPEVGKPRLSMFHMAACEAADGEFAQYKPVERQLAAQHFRRIIADADLASYASAVEVKAWDDLVVGQVRNFLGPAMAFCFEHCLQRVQDHVFDHQDHKVAVVFDQGIDRSRLHDIIDLYKNISDSRVEFVSITFAKVADVYPLQAADVIATQNYWLAQEALGIRPSDKDPDISFRHSFAERAAEGLLMGRAEIETELRHRGPDGRLLPVSNVLMTRGNR
jgi:hypothetical protein